jgi:hypothetical protein
MPYADPERRRAFHREYARTRRIGGDRSTPGQPSTLPAVFRLQTAQDVIDLLEGQVAAVLGSKADTITKARTVTYVAGVILRAIENGNLSARIEALESVLGRRNGDT